MRYQNGVSLIEATIVVAFFMVIVTAISPYFFGELAVYGQSQSIQQSINKIVDESREHYAKSVLATRCLTQNDLDINKISQPSNDGNATYDVRYLQHSTLNVRPIGIEVAVTPVLITLNQVSRYLNPDSITNTSLLFRYPLEYQLANWSGWDTATNCLR